MEFKYDELEYIGIIVSHGSMFRDTGTGLSREAMGNGLKVTELGTTPGTRNVAFVINH